MKINLPQSVIEELPAPASDDGLIRVTVGLKREADGSMNLVEVNDSPVPMSEEESEAAEETSEAAPTPPDASEADKMAEYSDTATNQLNAL